MYQLKQIARYIGFRQILNNYQYLRSFEPWLGKLNNSQLDKLKELISYSGDVTRKKIELKRTSKPHHGHELQGAIRQI
ncbi:hypothetical protein BpHYR1_019479 [Brachionus plicatilis]|uniref:Uncharacterized protein n=1 Tax=Brachionus plicatilis TaxID=10195 RepID=A0A3M7RBV0_BRAPC|nr:hypothetical protein BpHYR1_019479 [Brachionus plicatilis]